MRNKLIKTPFTHVRPLRPVGHTRRSWIRETLENGGYKTHTNFSLLRLLNQQYREIESLKAQIPQWISVEDRLPEVGDAVIAGCWERGTIILAKYLKEGFTVYQETSVTHWMPAPKLPATKEPS